MRFTTDRLSLCTEFTKWGYILKSTIGFFRIPIYASIYEYATIYENDGEISYV